MPRFAMACNLRVIDSTDRLPALRIRSLHKSFARGSAISPTRFAALVDVSFDLMRGEVLGIVGAAGAGKTTLLQCAAGILRRDRGFVDWFGEPFAGGGCLPDVAFVPAMPVYYPFLTVRDVLEYRLAKTGMTLLQRNRAIESALERLDLSASSAASVSDLAREAVKRLAIAEALTGEPKIIFLDSTPADMTAACPPPVLSALASEAAGGRAVVVAVRDAGVIAPIASRILLLEKGRNAGVFSSEQPRLEAALPQFPVIETRTRFVAERMH